MKKPRLHHLLPLAALTPSSDAAAAPAVTPAPVGSRAIPTKPFETTANRTDVLAITDLSFSAPIASIGRTVRVTVTIKNTSKVTIANVEWRLTDGQLLTKTGTVASIAPGSTEKVTVDVPASTLGDRDVVFTIDPATKIEKVAKDRLNNEVRGKLIVVGTPSQWHDWAQKAAGKVGQLIAVTKPFACMEGTVNGPMLMVTKIDPGPPNLNILTNLLVADGIEQAVAQAFATTFSNAYRAWALDYRGAFPAFPSFAAFPGPVAPPTPNVDMSLVVGTSPAGIKAMSATELEASTRALLGARVNEPGATDAIKQLSMSMAAQFLTWTTTQPIFVLGTGPVPTYAPPYVPVGPVVGGSIVRAGSCGHLP